MSGFAQTERSKLKRLPKRGDYDREIIYGIIDEALICHVGFVQDNQPFVIPTIHARVDDNIVLHGSKASRLLKYVESGGEVCITATMLDGLVLARSVFHHSMNYRSAVLFGTGRAIEGESEKLRALEAVSEHVMPGRWQDARKPNRKELNATTVVSIPIEDASAKIRTGPPVDEPEDYDLPIWAGVVPIKQKAFTPENDPQLGAGITVPDYVIKQVR